jgi:folate-binding Fe-S cluster repair protein YgfZ
MTTLTPADLDDYRKLTTSVALIDLTSLRSRVELTGDDRRKFLHNFCTNDVNGLADGAGCEAFLLDAKGHVLFYVFIFARPDRLIVEAAAWRGEALVKHLDKYLIREKVKLRDLSQEWSELLVAGPQAADVLKNSLSIDVPATPQSNGTVTGDVAIVRSVWTPEDNFCVLGPTTAIEEARQKLIAAGVRSGGAAALESLRVETGLPLDGVDVTDKNLAQEVDRNDRTLNFAELPQRLLSRPRNGRSARRPGARQQTTRRPEVCRGRRRESAAGRGDARRRHDHFCCVLTSTQCRARAGLSPRELDRAGDENRHAVRPRRSRGVAVHLISKHITALRLRM